MKYTLTKLPKSRVRLAIEHSPQELAEAKEKAVEQLGRQVRVEGFRPGKAPKEVVEGRLDPAAVLEEAGFSLINRTFRDLVKKENLDVIGEPSAQILKLAEGNPFSYRVDVDIIPAIALPDYKVIASRVKKRSATVEEEEIDGALEWLRQQRKKEDGTLLDLSDELAKSLGGFESLDALRASVREGLTTEKQTMNAQIARQEALENITAACRFDIPASLLEREQLRMAERVRQPEGQEKTKEELAKSFEKEAEKRVRSFLVLKAIAKKEAIAPTAEEIQKETDALLQHYPDAKTATERIDPLQIRLYTEDVLTNEKTFQFLETFISL
ncbi:MAG: hypothetical protein HYS76_00295 [Candidatus Wildermuthbacteria bacterium]|nr:hypothetical protein [Candidatus Wildermuthbacteria bacterium]